MYRSTLEDLLCPADHAATRLAVEMVLEEAGDGEVLEAVLACPECGRWHRVESGVADLVRDGLRDVEAEAAFLARHADALRATGLSLTAGGGHWSTDRVTEEDRRIIAEGHHWGRYLRHFHAAGDRCILDPRARGTYPRFYTAGILEPDDRDRWRRWGFFSPRAAEILFDDLPSFAGQQGFELGCGGGQFGLEAARQGVRVVAMDPSFEELAIGRSYAREIGVTGIDYVRGETANPPLPPGSVDLLLAKDSLHHVPNLARVFPRVLEVLKDGGTILTHEHVDNGAWRQRLHEWVRVRAMAKILRRYPAVPIPPDLLRDSANEDVSASVIPGLLDQHFRAVHVQRDLYLALDVEALVYFAFGKRKWLARLAYGVFSGAERLLLLAGERQHLTFRGEKREPTR